MKNAQYKFEIEILTKYNLQGRRKALKYAAMFGGRVYESPKQHGYAVCFELDTDEEYMAVKRTIFKLEELKKELPS